MNRRIRRWTWIVTLCGAASLGVGAQSTPAPATPPAAQTDNPAPKKAKHVYTNDDIGSSRDAAKPADNPTEPAEVSLPTGPKVSADQVRTAVRKQKARIAEAEANRDRILKLGARAQKSNQLKQAQTRVDKEKASLASMQETFRKMGYGSSVYDAN